MHATRASLFALLCASLTVAAGCSSSTDATGRDRNGGSGGGAGAPITFDPSTGRATVGNNCAAESHAAETLPVDMYIMLDQSGSMMEMVSGGVSRWSAVSGALATFVQSSATAGMSAGIQYFGVTAAAPTTCSDPYYCPGMYTGAWMSSCNASDYATPDVEIAPLPGNGGAIANSIGRHMPASDTPTQPALQGAIDHASTWAKAHGNPTVVVLATDGEPNGCASSVQGVAQVAAAGLAATPSILTFVIGVGTSLASLDTIAQSGGTTKSYIVDNSQNVNTQFLDALSAIRGSLVIPCQYKIPQAADGKSTLDLNSVNVAFTSGGGQSSTILEVNDKGQCDASSGGWYYDNPQNPSIIQLCEATCNQVGQEKGGSVSVLIGCQSEHAPLH